MIVCDTIAPVEEKRRKFSLQRKKEKKKKRKMGEMGEMTDGIRIVCTLESKEAFTNSTGHAHPSLRMLYCIACARFLLSFLCSIPTKEPFVENMNCVCLPFHNAIPDQWRMSVLAF